MQLNLIRPQKPAVDGEQTLSDGHYNATTQQNRAVCVTDSLETTLQIVQSDLTNTAILSKGNTHG